ncbi:fimbrillin family protein [Segatella copri]|uniref:fimbrillin family protein n=1 Tax=Segatella copri TaxID=165179 RepID=UPI00222F5F55|nr:fimbrillin family protein [Segatella copri]MCW4085357.1 fimbrillin family protein [Segatella copri]MCW4160235.1 fimbrillin family protein [Segatella copri]
MKAIKILTMAALATAVFASCSSEDELAQNNYPMDNVVRIMTSVDGMNTRASYGNSTDKLKSFGFCIKNANSEKYTYDNIKVSQKGYNWIPATQMLWQNSTTAVDILAYAPYQETTEDANGKVKVFGKTDYAFSVKEDQSNAEDYSSDLIVFKQTGFTPVSELNTSKAVEVAFTHLLSQLNLIIELRDQFNTNNNTVTKGFVTDVKVNGTIISSKVDFSASPISVQVDGTQTAAITPETTGFTPAENATAHAVFNYSAIVIPQTVAAGNFSISFKVNNTEYIWTATDAVTFESGKKHELHLLAGKDVVQGGAISAKPWGKETITEKETD